MRLITRFELAAKNTTELRSLHKEVFNALVRSEPLTLERVNVLASLENIENELTSGLYALDFLTTEIVGSWHIRYQEFVS